MKNLILIFTLLTMFLATLAGKELISVKGKVTGAWHPELAICNGKDFFPVAQDGSFSFEFKQSSGTPFLYLAMPDSIKAVSQWKFPLKYGANTFEFKVESCQVNTGLFNFIHGSDVQFDFIGQKGELEDLVNQISAVMKQNKCAFITLPGDLSTHGDFPRLQALKAALDKKSITYFEVFGGHDAILSKPLPLSHFTQVFGSPYSSWNRNGIHFIAPVTESNFLTSEERSRQLEWLKNDLNRLAPGVPAIILTHVPSALPKEFITLLKSSKRKVHAFLGGHHHLDNIYSRKGSVSIYNTPLRSNEAGSLTRKLRIVTLSAATGVKATRTRFLGYDRFARGVLGSDGRAQIQIYDTVSEVKYAFLKQGNIRIPLAKKNSFFYEISPVKPGRYLLCAGFSDGRQIEKELTLEVDSKIKWSFAPEALLLNRPFCVSDGKRIYFNSTTSDYPCSGGVTALDKATGAKLWHTALGENIDAGIALWKEQIFAVSSAGVFYVLDRNTGSVILKKDLAENLEANAFIRCASPPVVTEKGKVFIQGTGITPVLYDAVSGSFTELPQLRTNLVFQGAGVSGELIALTAPGPILFNAAENKVLWQAKAKVGAGSQAAPLFHGNAVFFALQRLLIKVELQSGKILWSQAVFGRRQEMGGMVISGNHLVYSALNKIGVYDKNCGKRIKIINLPPLTGENSSFRTPFNQAVPLLCTNDVLIPSDSGKLLQFSPETGKLRTISNPGVSFQGQAALEKGNLFAAGAQGIIFAFSE